VTPSTVPVPGGDATDLTATLDKTLTERFGIGIQNGYNWIGRKDASTLVGWQNLLAYVKYEAILDPEHEFLFSVGTAHEFGGTGTAVIVAPGVAYSGQGWQFGIEARVPGNSAAGHGVGVLAQFSLSFDYFFPDSIGRPLFAGR